MIPKKLNFVWVGDESNCPDIVIDTWKVNHPGWEIIIWRNNEFHFHDWKLKDLMKEMWDSDQLCGVADLMRWEILAKYGGYTVDADLISLATLPDWLSDCSFFASYENETVRKGLISNGIVGCEIGSKDAKRIMNFLLSKKHIAYKYNFMHWKYKKNKAWEVTGPKLLTKLISFSETATILPSHFFLPVNHTGEYYSGTDPVYAHQLWGSTKNGYESLIAVDITTQELIEGMKRKIMALRG